MEFDIPKERPSIIKVIGVGGGGSNAVNHMFRQGIKGVDFLVCNTDAQALDVSPVPVKIQLGSSLTEGRGAGSLPEIGKNSAIENIEDIKSSLGPATKMVFITAGMGGGTGTGAAPIIAGVAKEMGVLTVGIVTVPFGFEGKKRKSQAEAGIQELKNNVDTLLIISNDKLRLIHGDLKLTDAFGRADDILTIAAKSIAEIITVTGYINVDFADVQTVLRNSGVAIMGRATAEGDNRALAAAELALESPLLNDSNISGARYVLLSIISGNNEVTMDEIGEITDFIQEQAGDGADIIFGTGIDDTLGEKICITVIATGFEAGMATLDKKTEAKVVVNLNENKSEEKVEENNQVEYSQEDYLEPVLKSDLEKEAFEVQLEQPEFIMPIEENPEYNLVIRTIDPDEEKAETAEWEFNSFVNSEETGFANETESNFSTSIETENTLIESESAPTSTSTAEMEIRNSLSENQTTTTAETNEDEFARKTRERIDKLRKISYENHSRLATNPNAVVDFEKEPAYKRRQIELEKFPDSSQSQMSHLVLFEDADKKVEIRSGNSFYTDKVD